MKGQSVIEFVLLMLVVVGLSLGMLALVNGEIAKLWTAMVNQVIGPFDQVTVP